MAPTNETAPTDPDRQVGRGYTAISGVALLLVGYGAHRANLRSPFPMLIVLLGSTYVFTSLIALLSNTFRIWLAAFSQGVAKRLTIPRSAVPVLLTGFGFCLTGSLTAGPASNATLPISLPLWILGITLTYLSLRDRRGKRTPAGTSKHDRWIILALILFGAYIRSVALEAMPYVLSGDEGSVGLVGWEFVAGTRDNPLGLGWFSFPAFYSWLLSLSQIFLGRSTMAIRLVSTIVGSLTIAATYLTAKKLFNRPTGLVAAAWLASFHYHVFFSRIAYNNIFDGLFLILCVGALYQGWKEKDRNAFLFAGLALGLSQYFYTTARAIPLILILWLPWLHLRHASLKSRYQDLLAALLFAAAISLPLIVTYILQPSSLIFTAGRVSLLDPTLLRPAAEALGTSPAGLVMEQTLVTALGLTVSELQGIYVDSGQPLLFGLSAVVFYFGLVRLCFAWRRTPSGIIWITLFASILIGGLSVQAPSSQRLILLPPILALILADTLCAAHRWLQTRRTEWRLFSGILLVMALGWMSYENLQQLFFDYFQHEHYGSVNGEVTQEMIDYLQDESPQTRFIFIGGDRMAFDSIPSIDYLAPTYSAMSIERIEDIPLPSSVSTRAVYFILPEQQLALNRLAQTYPESSVFARYNRQGRLLFYVRVVEPDS